MKVRRLLKIQRNQCLGPYKRRHRRRVNQICRFSAARMVRFKARLVCLGPEIMARYPLVGSYMQSPDGVFVL
jgi:hypothetical protein